MLSWFKIIVSCAFISLSLLCNACSESSINKKMEIKLKGKLFKAHSHIRPFVLQKIIKLNAKPTQEEIDRATRRLIVRMLNYTTKEDEDIRQTMHLTYTAILEHQEDPPYDFEKRHKTYLVALGESKAESVERLYTLLPNTALWLKSKALLKICEETFKSNQQES